MTDDRKCPLCGEQFPDGARTVPINQLLVQPIAMLRDQIEQLSVEAIHLHETGKQKAEFAVLEQIRLHCETLSRVVKVFLE